MRLVTLDLLLLLPISDAHCFFFLLFLFSGNRPFLTPTFLHPRLTLGTTLRRLLTQAGPPEVLPQNLHLELDANLNLPRVPQEMYSWKWLMAIFYCEDYCGVWGRMSHAESLSVATEDTHAQKEQRERASSRLSHSALGRHHHPSPRGLVKTGLHP